MIQWLHKYVFRGLGWVMLLCMITIIYLTIQSMRAGR
jgi:hypothetical protein